MKQAPKLRKVIAYILVLLLAIGLVIGLVYRNFWGYGWQQLIGQWKLIQGARPIKALLHEEPYKSQWGEQLRLVLAIKRYASDSLGLDTANTYEELYVEAEEKLPNMWVVTAAAPYALRAYEWSFPIVGRLPYKGFFELSAAKEEEQRLVEEGYDTRLSKASGWSTLGWIENPLLPQMLMRSPGRLSELLIHELTHNTIYVKGRANFNENLASFIGKEGAIGFLSHYYGADSDTLSAYLQEISDRRQWYMHWIRATARMDSLYHRIEGRSEADKMRYKQALLAEIGYEVDTICFRTLRWQAIQRQPRRLNNAFLMKFLRYSGQEDSLHAAWTSQGASLHAYLREVVEAQGRGGL